MVNGLTQKQKTFTLGLFKGLSQREAYIAAGYSAKQSLRVIDRNACVLAKTNKVLIRWNELNKEAEDVTIATVKERKQILTQIARGDITDYLTCGPDRDLISVGSESPNTRALSEVTSRTEYDEKGAGVAVVTKIKLHNPIQAIAEHNRMERVGSDVAPAQAPVVNSFTFILPGGTKVSPKELKEHAKEDVQGQSEDSKRIVSRLLGDDVDG